MFFYCRPQLQMTDNTTTTLSNDLVAAAAVQFVDSVKDVTSSSWDERLQFGVPIKEGDADRLEVDSDEKSSTHFVGDIRVRCIICNGPKVGRNNNSTKFSDAINKKLDKLYSSPCIVGQDECFDNAHTGERSKCKSCKSRLMNAGLTEAEAVKFCSQPKQGASADSRICRDENTDKLIEGVRQLEEKMKEAEKLQDADGQRAAASERGPAAREVALKKARNEKMEAARQVGWDGKGEWEGYLTWKHPNKPAGDEATAETKKTEKANTRVRNAERNAREIAAEDRAEAEENMGAFDRMALKRKAAAIAMLPVSIVPEDVLMAGAEELSAVQAQMDDDPFADAALDDQPPALEGDWMADDNGVEGPPLPNLLVNKRPRRGSGGSAPVRGRRGSKTPIVAEGVASLLAKGNAEYNEKKKLAQRVTRSKQKVEIGGMMEGYQYLQDEIVKLTGVDLMPGAQLDTKAHCGMRGPCMARRAVAYVSAQQDRIAILKDLLQSKLQLQEGQFKLYLANADYTESVSYAKDLSDEEKNSVLRALGIENEDENDGVEDDA